MLVWVVFQAAIGERSQAVIGCSFTDVRLDPRPSPAGVSFFQHSLKPKKFFGGPEGSKLPSRKVGSSASCFISRSRGHPSQTHHRRQTFRCRGPCSRRPSRTRPATSPSPAP